MACRRIRVILHMTCSNLLMNMLSSCRIICISSFVCKPSVTTYPVACANVDICSSCVDISGCKQPVSKSTVAVFAARSAEAISVYDRFTGGATDSDKVGVCLLFNDNGMNINSSSALPSGCFLLEMISYSGVVLSPQVKMLCNVVLY